MPSKDPETRKAYDAAYRAANKEKRIAAAAAWYAANREKKATYDAARYVANREKIAAHNAANREKKAAYDTARYAANREKKAATAAAYRAANREKITATAAAWRAANPDKIAAIQARREHLENTAPGGPFSYARKDYQARIAEYGGLCAYCLKAPYTELDHAIPLSRGGTNHMYNIFPACLPCNRNKYNKILWDGWTPPRDREIQT